MGLLSHSRWFWNPVRYTEAQATEFRELRALYQRYLSPVLGSAYPYFLKLQDEKDPYQPAYGQGEWKAEDMKVAEEKGEGLKAFTRGMVGTLGVFEQRRGQRLFGKGYSNDPTSLLLYYLREEFDRLGALTSNQGTLDRVLALKDFLDAIRRGHLFTQEPEDYGSLDVLIRNVVAKLEVLETHVRDDMALESAREHFKQLKAMIHRILDQSVAYLFSAVAEKSRTHLSLSLLSAPSGVVDEGLQASLQTREGALLKNLIQHPAMLRVLFPQREVAVRTFGEPLGLLGEAQGTPFLDEKGQANPTWLDFLQKTPAQEAQLDPRLTALPSGVSLTVLAEAKAARPGDTSALANFVRLQGLLLTLATFQHYVESCWQLAGLGGDQLLYERLAETITTLLTELFDFNRALQTSLAVFQRQLDVLDAEAFRQQKDKAWQKNYEQAKACQGVLLKMLEECEGLLNKILADAKDRAARSQRLQAGAIALQRLEGAQDFLNTARRQVGSEPLLSYPGLSVSASIVGAVSTVQTFEALLLILVPQSPERVVSLTQLCRETPQALPWSIFRGTYRRAAYLQSQGRLFRLGEGIARLEQYPGYAASTEGRAAMEQLKTHCASELTRIRRLSANLYWPFHQSSLLFFASWERVFEENQSRLHALERGLKKEPLQKTGMLMEPIEPSEAVTSQLEALWAKTLEEEAFWNRYPSSLAESPLPAEELKASRATSPVPVLSSLEREETPNGGFFETKTH